jgi:XTP/dITP diphosphohydrolase
MKLILATQNPGKINEMRAILNRPGLEVLSLDEVGDDAPEVVEDGETFLDNARKKALAVAQWAGMPALADDSGLVVDALDGRPGVHSARYAGEEGDMEANMDLLLSQMEEVPNEVRRAHFECVICLASPDGATWETEGQVDGMIAREKKGGGGFGYDPIFFYPQAGMTFAEMPPMVKNLVSHRFRAIKAMASKLSVIEKELEK